MAEPAIEYERELYARLLKGDEKAFKVIFETYTPRMVNYATAMVKSSAIAEELVQDCYNNLFLLPES